MHKLGLSGLRFQINNPFVNIKPKHV